jgi:IS4 transposase
VNRFCSIFSQLLKLFSRLEFQQLVKETRAERHARGFPSWDQFVAMLFCQLGRAQSLREICGGLASCEGRLVHLGASAAPSRSTLAYANAHRPWQLYEAVFHRLLGRCQELTARAQKKFRFKNKLLSLDATVIDLCASVFCWAKYQRTKGAVKLHLLLDHDGYLPTVAVITEGKVADVRVARQLRFEPGTILIMDRGYVDFAWFDRLTAQGVFFVTRPKTGMAYEVVEHRTIDIDGNLLSDQIIELTSETGQKVAWQLRRIEIWVPEKEQRMALLTNHLDLSALTIAAIYKERWQVELFFKALKQNLKIKTFVGTTANALRIQIWTALIAMLLLRYLQLRSTFGWSLSNLVALLRMNLFVHRDLWAWINQPFDKPPEIPEPVQAHLALA